MITATTTVMIQSFLLLTFLPYVFCFNALGKLLLQVYVLISRPSTRRFHRSTSSHIQNSTVPHSNSSTEPPRPLNHRALGGPYKTHSRILLVRKSSLH